MKTIAKTVQALLFCSLIIAPSAFANAADERDYRDSQARTSADAAVDADTNLNMRDRDASAGVRAGVNTRTSMDRVSDNTRNRDVNLGATTSTTAVTR